MQYALCTALAQSPAAPCSSCMRRQHVPSLRRAGAGAALACGGAVCESNKGLLVV